MWLKPFEKLKNTNGATSFRKQKLDILVGTAH